MINEKSRLWSPFAALPSDRIDSFTVVRGEGQYVFDDRGKKYLDGIAGLWYNHIGHGRTRMAEAIAAQARILAAYQTHGDYDNLPALSLAERLASLLPVEDPLVFFGSGGGDGIETACKLARAYWRESGVDTKTVLLSRQNGYHGMSGFGSSVVGIPALHEGSEDGFPGATVPANDAGALADAVQEIGADRVAGFIAEPVIGAGGVMPPPEGYFQAVEEICRENEILLICDEVVTAFGRLGTWSGAEYYGLAPDMAVVAKGLTSGYIPLGAVLASRRIWERFEQNGTVFRHGFTYSGHPTACAAGIENLEILAEEDLIGRAAHLAPTFGEVLGTLEDLEAVGEVRQVGLMAGIGFDQDVVGTRTWTARQVDFGAAVNARCRRSGLILRRMFTGDLQVSPPLVIDREDVEFIRDVVADAVGAVMAE